MRSVNLPFYARLALTLLAIVLIFFILRIAQNLFIPLVFGLLISILLYPVSKFMENNLRMGRALGALMAVLLFVFCLCMFIYFLTYQVISFSSDFPLLRTRFFGMFYSLQQWLSFKLHITSVQQESYIDRSVNSFVESGAKSISNVFISVTSVLVLAIFVFMFTFFMLFHRKLLMKFMLHLFNEQYRPKVYEVIVETKSLINEYVLGLLLEMVIISIVNSSMLLYMGIKYALLLGVMAAVLNIIPYLGIYTSIALIMLVTLANSNGSHAFEAGLGLFLVHLLDANILMPRIVGARVKMNPFITVVAVILGEFTWGIPGMFLFIPVMGIMKLICDRVEGLEAWGLLIGVEVVEKKPKNKISFDKKNLKE